MENIHRVIICSTDQSVFLLSIESGLAALPEVETIRINPHLPDVTARIAALEPDLILLEKGRNDEIPLALLHEHIPLILIDSDERKIITISGAKVQKAEIGDLVQTIQSSLQDIAA